VIVHSYLTEEDKSYCRTELINELKRLLAWAEKEMDWTDWAYMTLNVRIQKKTREDED
jgi:hypothetical protein